MPTDPPVIFDPETLHVGGARVGPFQEQHTAWTLKTFPQETRTMRISHLREEIVEIEDAKTPEQLIEECADAYLLILGIAGTTGCDLENAAQRKFVALQGAQWYFDVERGHYRRVK